MNATPERSVGLSRRTRRETEEAPSEATAGPYRTLLGNQSLTNLTAAFACITIAEWGYVTALSVFAFRQSGALAVGLVGLRLFFSSGSAFISSAFVPRWRVGRVLSLIGAARFTGVAVSAALAASGAPFVFLLVLLYLDGLVAGPYRPAQSALVPTLARSPKELVSSAMALSTVKTLSQAVGAVVGGTLLSLTSPEVVFGGGSGLFFCAAVITWRFRKGAAATTKATSPRRILTTLSETARLSRGPNVRSILMLSGLRTFVRGMWSAIAVIASLKLLHAGSTGVGLLMMASGIGSLAAAPLSARLVTMRRLGTPAAIALVACGAPLAVIAGIPVLGVAAALIAAWGIGMAVADVATSSMLHRLLEAPAVPRVTAAIEAAKLALEGTGGFLAPLLVSLFSVRIALIIAAVPLPFVVVSGWRSLHRVDAEAAERARLIELLHSVPFLRPLDMASLDGLVARLVPIVIPEPGTDIVVQGDAGDSFYVVERGSAEVLIDGFVISFVVAGDGFGERSLLRNVPRTATVRSREPTHLLMLSREDFLAAVLGQEADEVPEVEAGGVSAASEWTLKNRVDALSKISLLSHLDRGQLTIMAERCVRTEWAAGERIVSQGEDGDTFYVVLDGRADVLVDGHKVNELLPGDQFGEIALLHDVPRTADVVAVTPVVTMSVGRQNLLGPVRARLALG